MKNQIPTFFETHCTLLLSRNISSCTNGGDLDLVPIFSIFQVKTTILFTFYLKKWRKWTLNPNPLRQYIRIYFQIVKVHKLYFFSYQLSQKIILAILVFFSIYTVKKKLKLSSKLFQTQNIITITFRSEIFHFIFVTLDVVAF